jgi:hypothetical protein
VRRDGWGVSEPAQDRCTPTDVDAALDDTGRRWIGAQHVPGGSAELLRPSAPPPPRPGQVRSPSAARRRPRIRAHVLLRWLALLLIRVAERRARLTWRHINRELGRLHAITLSGPAGTLVQTTEPTTAQAGILRACGLTPPPRITTLDPRLSCANILTGRPPGMDTHPHRRCTPVPASQPTNSAPHLPTNCGTRA